MIRAKDKNDENRNHSQQQELVALGLLQIWPTRNVFTSMLFVVMVQSRFGTDILGSGVDLIGIHRQRKWMTFWMTFSLKIAVFLSSTPSQTLMNPMFQDTPLAWGSGGRRFKSSRPDQEMQGFAGLPPEAFLLGCPLGTRLLF
jgi:hypothetical protein